jgi:hypothetical protein
VFHSKKQEIMEEALRMAKIPEQEKALIKIITATGAQYPIQQRITPTQPNWNTDNDVLTNTPLKTNIKPLATARERTRTAWAVFKYCGTKTVPLE